MGGEAAIFMEINLKNIVSALTLGSLLAAASCAHANTTRIDTAGFTISYVDGNRPSQWDIGLSGATDGAATIDLKTLNRQLSYIYAGPNGTLEAEAGANHYSVLHVDVHEGYSISNLGFLGQAQGAHHAYWQLGEAPAFAENSLDMRWSVISSTGTRSQNLLQVKDLDYGINFGHSLGEFNYGSSFDIVLNGWTWAYVQQSANSAWGPTAMASAGIYGTALQFDVAKNVSPVPEPATGAMLLAGLAVVAGVTRRRASNKA